MSTAPVKSKTVLVTGCSSGIGLATAKGLKERGWRVVPTARKTGDLEMLRAEGFDPVKLDVAESASIADASNEVLSRFDGQLGALVNNAGFGLTVAMEDCSREMLRSIFEVNLFGLTELTNRFIPVFRKQKYGRIVNISSVLGEISIPLTGPYCASKRALEAATDSMRIELAGSGIGVSLVQPGPIASAFSRNLAHRTDEFDVNPDSVFSSFYKEAIETRKDGSAGRTAEGFMKPPEAVAEAVFQCLEKRRPPIRVRVTAVAHFGAFVRRFLPAAVMDAITVSQLRKKLG